MTRSPESSPPEAGATGPAKVEVRRSRRRRRSVQAYRDHDTIVVLVPASLTKAEEASWVSEMVNRVERSEARRRRAAPTGGEELMARAERLSAQFLDRQAVPASVRWVSNQNARWGSCTPSTRTIRLSDRLRPMPGWVVDYVLLHELAHLIEHGHGPGFWRLLDRYPRTQKAQGYLEGVHATADLVGRWPTLPDPGPAPDSTGDSSCLQPELPL